MGAPTSGAAPPPCDTASRSSCPAARDAVLPVPAAATRGQGPAGAAAAAVHAVSASVPLASFAGWPATAGNCSNTKTRRGDIGERKRAYGPRSTDDPAAAAAVGGWVRTSTSSSSWMGGDASQVAGSVVAEAQARDDMAGGVPADACGTSSAAAGLVPDAPSSATAAAGPLPDPSSTFTPSASARRGRFPGGPPAGAALPSVCPGSRAVPSSSREICAKARFTGPLRPGPGPAAAICS